MTNKIVAAMLIAVCVLGCKNLGLNKEALPTVLNVNDLNDQHKKDKEALRTKYDGKEVIVMGRATEDFDPNHVYFEIGDKQLSFSLQADRSQETWVGVDCVVLAANKDKFAGIKKDDVFAVKGIFHITQGGMEVSPCTRELRE
jgi:putative nucleic acid binding protein